MEICYALILAAICTSLVNSKDEYTSGWFFRNYLDLPEVPDDIPDGAIGVYLNNNNISSLEPGGFSNLSNCTFISLAHNYIDTIKPGAFRGLNKIRDLILFANQIPDLKTAMFRGLDSLQYMVLSNNSITTIHSGALEGLHNLHKLYLFGNKLTVLSHKMFAGLDSLVEIILSFNLIHDIVPGTFIGLHNLTELWLDNNALSSLKTSSFLGLDSMKLLHLNYNNISSIELGTFDIMNKTIRTLWLDTNKLSNVTGLFTELKGIIKIDLDINALTDIPPDTFYGLDNLTEVWFYTNKLTTLRANTFTGLPRPLEITLGDNPLQCDRRLCWIKRGEREGWLKWIPYEDRPLVPTCSNGVHWDNLNLDCPAEVECSHPGTVAHAAHGEFEWPLVVGTRVNYRCRECYSGGGDIVCQGDGTWSQKPVCTEKKCSGPPDVTNALRVPDVAEYACGSHVTYICNHGYRLHGDGWVTCRKDTTFGEVNFSCEKEDDGAPFVLPSTQEHSDNNNVTWIAVGIGSLVLLLIVIALIMYLMRRRKPAVTRSGSNMTTDSASGSTVGGASGGSAVGDGSGGFINKAAMLQDDLSYAELREKEGLPAEFVPGTPSPLPPGDSGTSPAPLHPLTPPGYDTPTDPPEYTPNNSFAGSNPL